MARRQPSTAVRPLGPEPRRSQGRDPVRLVALALFVVGAAAGYLIGLPSDTTATPEAATTTAPPVGAGSPIVDVTDYAWTQQSSPDFTPRLWAVHTAIEFDGYIYALITDDIQNRISRALWRTADGAAWEQLPLELGSAGVATDLDIRGERLVISGWEGSRPAIWTSSAIGETTELTWRPIRLAQGELPIGNLVPVFSEVRTEINSAGEHVVVAAMQYSIDPQDFQPGGEPNGSGTPQPEIAIHESQIWTRTVDAAGREVVGIVPLPDPITIQPISGPVGTRVTELSAWAMWVSPDGSTYSAVDPIEGLDLAPEVSAFNDGFAASTLSLATRTYEILTSTDGTVWNPISRPVPERCGKARPGVVGAAVLLVASEDFSHTCTTSDGISWRVNPTPQTTVSDNAFLWITGNDTGFLAQAVNSQERPVLESADGITWRQIGLEPAMAIGGAYLAGERVINVARADGQRRPRPWTMWVGQRLES